LSIERQWLPQALAGLVTESTFVGLQQFFGIDVQGTRPRLRVEERERPGQASLAGQLETSPGGVISH
jgi:hypothetical protein